MRLLKLSAGMLLIGSGAAWAQTSGTPCDTTAYSCSVTSTNGQSAPPAPSAGFDKSGHSGGPGTAAGPVNITVSGAPGGNGDPSPWFALYDPVIRLEAIGGSGADGGTASDGSAAPIGGLAGGSGGQGAAGGSITLTVPQGSPVQVVGLQDSTAIQVTSQGGSGGGGALASFGGISGTSSSGAQGGDVNVTLLAAPVQSNSMVQESTSAVTASGTGILAQSIGGSGGSGHSYNGDISYVKFGVAGADSNGPGGNVTVTFNSTIAAYAAYSSMGSPASTSPGAGIWAVSAGGNGGSGGKGESTDGGQGGQGGAAANGGAVDVNVQGGSIATLSGLSYTPAVWAQSLGGIGGAGGSSGFGSGGDSGAGGNGGNVSVNNDGALSTASALHSPGILAQSFGGAGPNGGQAGAWGASGGEGATGGTGGTVLVTGTGSIQTATRNSPGVLAQSIGGGGGNGGDSNGWLAVGGVGGNGGSGGPVQINSGQNITTTGASSTGIMAQAVGGGGGNGGNATGTGVGVSLVIGGSGAQAGDGGTVAALNTGNIVTSGQHSSGMELQSIGGGGGKGGAAFGKNISGIFGAQVSVGGSGAGGGEAGWISFYSGATTTNSGVISTSGSDSFGILAQSIGGGGGTGAASVAQSTTYAPDDTPSLSLSAAIGGKGGGGGDASSVQIGNAGLIATTGAQGIGMAAQSVGGGGGNGGDASASATARGSEVNIAASVSLGGIGGSGGGGNWILIGNSGLIVTTGESADGMLAQSIGGGGGNGGSGDSSAKSSGDGTGISASVTIGGNGGGGGNASQQVNATNTGAILTLGDGAAGMVAQAIAGGGGRAGGAAGTSNGDYNVTVTVGGSGGNGGTALSTTQNPLNSVQVAHSGSIVTFGADAPGIAAQSIGGGGGMGGKSATSLGSKKSTGDGGNGSSATSSTMTALQNYFNSGYGSGSQYTNISTLATLANQLLGNSSVGASAGLLGANAASDASTLNDLGSSQGDDEDDSNATSITAKVAVGGSGGKGGSGGNVQVTNTGSIGTVGAMSDGILAQSIGGGGGKGGLATSSGSASVNENALDAPVSVGGSGGVAGVGSAVTVTNGDGTNPASIITIGSLANGIVAQSIGGGGGVGGVAGSRNGLLAGVNVSGKGLAIGGDSIGTSSDANTVTGGAVTVTNSANASILTMSHDAIGIVAQSIGGGGGIVKTLSTDAADNNGGAANPDPITISGSNAHDVSVTFGGSDTKNGSNGSGGAVSVTNSGSITTEGRNAYGVLAQSIGGGGGLVQGGEAGAGPNGFMNAGPMRGNGGGVTVTANDGSSIVTSGAGAVGIFAQSVGGGGGIAGDTGLTQLHLGYASNVNKPGWGNGGSVTVNVNSGASVQTAGANTPAIIAQSVAGGGGYIVAGGHNTQEGLYAGSVGGAGTSGVVTVNVGGSVSATGTASPGIYAQSVQTTGPSLAAQQININVSQGATVSGGVDYYKGGDGTAAGIQLYDGLVGNGTTSSGYNLVNNNGTITSVNGTGGSAIYSSDNTTFVHNGPGGVINGTINLTADGGNGWVQNDTGGQLNTGATVAAVAMNNDGIVDVGGKSAVGATTEVTGRLTQGIAGKVVIDSDHVAGASDRLTVDGNATLAGAIQMRPSRLSPTTVQVVDVKGQLDSSQLQSADPMLVHYQLSTASTTAADGSAQQSIFVTPQARFDVAASGLGKNAQSVASHLQSNFKAGSGGLAVPLAQLANNVQDAATYKAALTSLGNEAQQAVGILRLAASQAFVERMNSCPTFDQASGTDMKERDCAWGRIIDNSTTASGDEHANYHAETHSLQVGGQKQIADGWFLGGGAAYYNESLNSSTGAGSVSGNGGALGVVIKREVGNWTVSAAADLGYGSYDTKRNIAFAGYAAQATGALNLTQMGLHSRIAYLIPQQAFYLKPYLDLHVVHMHTGSYSERGAGVLGLNVNSNSGTMFAASPMLEMGGRVDMDNGMTLRPFVAVGATFHDRNEWGASAQLQGAAPGVNTFDTAATAPASLANVRLGLNVQLKKNLELKVEYDGQFGSGYKSNEGALRVNYLF